ncbi:hypothetical protein TBLA_0C01580 [Henningerozyma blattae CBS 6284]|uniref:RAVE complex protein Rav1 C-terminal domain-containing protein n=1 Tax=Henningerozyma blattae (strain ATCC 34711 / CBS 6284 / DSM 70876 / NBRC 10599 / NRRL Y-10934 / UCD 77-7) TaxID=1071380 RepID=I2H0S0_HENB6|nr:hypothetical protein TBLA_0C01580 [Tetrapisispora blattae CBS 6284]CCH59972.1 hypothetical protein TBLA_0C01580 [Tetrapisispora blattae CBS 6284]
MSLNYLPGRPQHTNQATNQTIWQGHTIFAYCSGNNLIILSNKFTRLQTLYLEKDCIAVDINPSNGFIAVAFDNLINVYKPIHQVMKNPKWAKCCQVFHDDSLVNCLKWGNNNELIVGSKYLSFWKIVDQFGEYKPVLLWNKLQSKPVYNVTISEDSQLVASFSKYDKFVKIWKRDSISDDKVIFQLTILPHSGFITSMRWKKTGLDNIKKQNSSTSLDELYPYISNTNNQTQVLYTISTDKKLRIWVCHEWNSRHMIQLWGHLKLKDDQHFFIIIDNWIVEKSLPNSFGDGYYKSVKPDLVIQGSTNGNLEVHALEELSHHPPKLMTKKTLFLKYVNKASFVKDPMYLNFSEIQPYDDTANDLSLIIHDLRGYIRHTVINLPTLLSENNTWIGALEHKFTGHTKSIQRLIRSSDGEAVLTLSRFSENCVWKPQTLRSGVTLRLKNYIITESPIKDAVVHGKGSLVICLLENNKIQAWECPDFISMTQEAREMEDEEDDDDNKISYMRQEIDLTSQINEIGDPILMSNTPELIHHYERHFITLVFKTGITKSFEVSLTRGIFEIKSGPLELIDNEIYKISIIDPVHASFTSDRPLLALISKNGLAKTFKGQVDTENKTLSWVKAFELNTGIKDATKIRGSSTGKLCIIDSTGKKITIWESSRSVLEYEETFEDTIKDNDWTSTEFGQNILSIGFTGYALLYTQLRYDYTNYSPSYLPIEKIDITSHTAHNIGDSIWLKNGIFACASGNQFYIKDKSLDLNDPFTHRSIGSRKILSNDILHLSSVLNGPLPVFHPQFLIQALYANKISLVVEIIMKLFIELRNVTFKNQNIATMSFDLGIEPSKFNITIEKKYPTVTFPDPYPEYNKNVNTLLTEYLSKITLPYMTRHQQITLITVAEAILDIIKYKDIVDDNGIRFLLGVRLFLSHKKTQNGLNMRDITWALHSDNKELLLSTIDHHLKLWKDARNFRIAYWAKQEDLVKKFENIAKLEFTKNDIKDPNNCAIYYLALKKKQVLLSLWKMSVGHPEQGKMIKFMSNDFTQPRWRTAALKNAYALLSKHRLMDGAVFFLLGGSVKDCVNVLCRQIKDIDLAIAVCRVYEGDDSPVLAEVLQKYILPDVVIQNDKWTASFIYWKLRKQEVAIRALITDPIELENNESIVCKEACVNKSFLVEDPALLLVYIHLRKRNLRYFIGSLKVDEKLEYDTVLRVTNILRRMGCDLLAVSFIRNWEFVEKSKNLSQLESARRQSITLPGISGNAILPTTTPQLRKSLFDKMDMREMEPNSTTSSSVFSRTKNILDDFSLQSGSSESGVTNILNQYSSSVSNSAKISTTPRSLLDQYGSSTTSQVINPSTSKRLLDDFEVDPLSSPDKSPEGAPIKSLLNEFMPSPNETTKKAPPQNTKPRNLLDDFM